MNETEPFNCLNGYLVVEKRKPFDFPAERPFLKNGRGNQHKFEPSEAGVVPFLSVFLTPSEPYLITSQRLIALSA